MIDLLALMGVLSHLVDLQRRRAWVAEHPAKSTMFNVPVPNEPVNQLHIIRYMTEMCKTIKQAVARG